MSSAPSHYFFSWKRWHVFPDFCLRGSWADFTWLSKKNNVPWDRYLVWKIPAQIVKIWQSNIGLEKKNIYIYSQMYLQVLVVSVPAYLPGRQLLPFCFILHWRIICISTPISFFSSLSYQKFLYYRFGRLLLTFFGTSTERLV